MAAQICSALEHAHKNHIVHRDIKPHNIILTNELVAKVTDFGIARAVSSSTLTMTGNTIGSVHYFSPEQARGGYTDEKSDLYSLGIVLYEMLTGKVPFDGDSPVTIALKHLEDKITPPNKIINNIPTSVNNIILKAVQKNQADRYQSASEMLEDLNDAFKEPNGDFVKVNNNFLEEQSTQRFNILDDIKKVKSISDSEFVINKGETEDMTAKKKSDRFTVIAALATSFIIILIISVMMGYFVSSKFFKKTVDIATPNLIGKNIEDIKQELKLNNIQLKEVPASSDEVKKGFIISQMPEPGINIKSPGGEIQVVVSNGPEMVTIPDLLGKDYKGAQYELDGRGLLLKAIYEPSADIKQNYVFKQNPPSNTMIPKNSEVEVFISTGKPPEKIKVPYLIGILENDAKQRITDNKLTVGEVKYLEDKNQPFGIVLNQNPLPNTELDESFKIDIVVNIYKQPDVVNNNNTDPDENTNNEPTAGSISINLGNINKLENEPFTVRVEVDSEMGQQTAYEQIHTINDGEISVPITGKGKSHIKVYIDDIFYFEDTKDLGGEDQ